jgi:hypothetical protein
MSKGMKKKKMKKNVIGKNKNTNLIIFFVLEWDQNKVNILDRRVE